MLTCFPETHGLVYDLIPQLLMPMPPLGQIPFIEKNKENPSKFDGIQNQWYPIFRTTERKKNKVTQRNLFSNNPSNKKEIVFSFGGRITGSLSVDSSAATAPGLLPVSKTMKNQGVRIYTHIVTFQTNQQKKKNSPSTQNLKILAELKRNYKNQKSKRKLQKKKQKAKK